MSKLIITFTIFICLISVVITSFISAADDNEEEATMTNEDERQQGVPVLQRVPTDEFPQAEFVEGLDDLSLDEMLKLFGGDNDSQQQDIRGSNAINDHDVNVFLDDGVTKKTKVLVIGANGATGRLTLQELIKTGKYLPIAMVRERSQEEAIRNDPAFFGKVATVVADLEYPMEFIFEDSQNFNKDHEIEAVIFAAGSKGKNVANVDLAGGIRAFSTAQKFPFVRRFIMLSATNVRPDSESSIKHYHRAKWYADEFIRDGDTFGRKDLFWTIVCPSTLTNEESEDIVGKVDLGKEYWVDRENTNFAQETNGKGVYRKGAVSARRNVAKVMVSSLDNENTYKKTFRLLDGEDSIDDALKKL